MDNLIVGIGAIGLFLVAIVGYYAFALIVRKLAERNLFMTLVDEGTAKAILRNNRFAFCLMSYSGYSFAGEVEKEDSDLDEVSRWDIKKTAQKEAWHLPLLRGIRWIGIPPFTAVHDYRFSWASLEEFEDEGSLLVKRPVAKDETIDYVLVQRDVYVSRIETVECKDNIPLDANILVGGHIVNPYRALFRIERWLESALDVTSSKMRNFFGSKTYDEIRQLAESTDEESQENQELMKYFKETLTWIEENIGFHIDFVRIYSIDPGSELAKDFVEATTKKYVAEQQAAADTAAGEGYAARDRAHFEAISRIEKGAEFFKWDSIRQSGLNTYVEGGGAVPAIPLGVPSQTPSNDGGDMDTPSSATQNKKGTVR